MFPSNGATHSWRGWKARLTIALALGTATLAGCRDLASPEIDAPTGAATTKPTVTDLNATAFSATSVTLSFTQVNDGANSPAKYDVRFAKKPLDWGTATSVVNGTCKTPLAGTAIGTKLACTVDGLTASTAYEFQLVSLRGSMNKDAVYGGLSNIAGITTLAAGSTPPPPPPPPPTTGSGECAQPKAGWIWCDDFESDRLGKYFEYDNAGGKFVRAASEGYGGSYAMRAHFDAGTVGAGNMKLAFGRTPDAYMRPVDGGTANYREIYWRIYVKNASDWTGGGGWKLSRATVFANGNWAQAAIGHVWSTPPDHGVLSLDPASGTNTSGALQTTTYNDFDHFRWLGMTPGKTRMFEGSFVGAWHCVEAHMRLNDAGSSNGVLELWVDGALDARTANLNWLGSFNAYGINSVLFENYWNDGAPKTENRWFDNIVVSTQPIGCVGAATPPPSEPPPPAPDTTKVLQKTSGDAQSGTAGAVLANPLKVRVVNGSGAAVSGASVRWAVANGGGSVSASSTSTDANGYAQVSFTLGAAGANSATASLTSGGSVTFTATAASVPTTQTLQKTSGDGQSGTTGSALAGPLKVRVINGSGAGVAGATVAWAVTAGGGSVSAPSTGTDGSGYAQVTLTLGSAGTNSVSASLASGGSVSFSESAAAPPPPPPSGSSGSNEPSGYTQITQRSFNAVLENGWYADATGGGSIVSDASAPKSPSNILRVTYPAGFHAGSSPLAEEFATGGHTKNYISLWLKLSDNFQGESSATNKVFFDWIHNNPSVFLSAEGVGSGTLTPTIRLQNVPDSREYLYPNVVSGTQLQRGRWYHVEMLLVANSPGSSNGQATMWLDGTLVTDYKNVQFSGSGQSNRWEYLQIFPIWGGMQSTVNQTMYMYFDDMYVSGSN